MNNEKLDKLEKFIDTFLEEKKKLHESNLVIQEKIEHIARTTIIADTFFKDDRLLKIALKYHDIGRFLQFEIFGDFNDGKVLHHYLGESIILKALNERKIEDSDELEIIRFAILYHGRMEYMLYKKYLPNRILEIVDLVSQIDSIDNGCIGAVKYIEREAKEDAKGYILKNQALNQLKVSDDVWEFYKKGEKFDKLVFCKTYADYALFAGILAITSLKGKNREIAKKSLNLTYIDKLSKNNVTALEKYKEVFFNLIEKEKSQKAYEILQGFYYSENFKYKELKE